MVRARSSIMEVRVCITPSQGGELPPNPPPYNTAPTQWPITTQSPRQPVARPQITQVQSFPTHVTQVKYKPPQTKQVQNMSGTKQVTCVRDHEGSTHTSHVLYRKNYTQDWPTLISSQFKQWLSRHNIHKGSSNCICDLNTVESSLSMGDQCLWLS